MLARHPHVESMIGQNFKSGPLMARALGQGGHQSRRAQSPIDGQERLGSVAQLSRFPIVIVASTTVSAALADWRAQTRFMVAAACLSVLVIVVLLFVIVRSLTAQHRESQRRLEQEKHRLDTALNNMTQGLALFDASARVVLCNQRYIDMYGLSRAVVKPGIHFYEAVRHRKETGSFKGDVDEYCSAILENVAQGKSPGPSGNPGMEARFRPSFGRSRKAVGLRPWKTSPNAEIWNGSVTGIMPSCSRSSTTYRRRSR